MPWGLGPRFVSDVVNGFSSSWNNRLTLATWFKWHHQGTVAAIGLRTTQVLFSADGTLTYIHNRNITMVQNFSRYNLTANVDIQITPTTPLDQVEAIVKRPAQAC